MGGRLSGKIALITGSAQGIGKSITSLFIAEGATVIATDKDYEALLVAKKEFDEFSQSETLCYEVDITDRKRIDRVVNDVIDKFSRIDILINNAGMNVFEDPTLITEDQWEKCYQINLKGSWNFSQSILPHFLKQEYGNVVNIASVHAHKIIKGCFPYPVFKHGLIGLTKSLGIEYADKNVRFNSISPGLILTPAIEKYFEAHATPEKEREYQTSLLPCKRIGTSEEVANTALFLASDEARFINATDILIDGGRSQVYND